MTALVLPDFKLISQVQQDDRTDDMNDAVRLVDTELVELANNREDVIITFSSPQGPITPLALPTSKVLPLIMKLIGAPLVTLNNSMNYDGSAPSLDADGLEISRHEADPKAIYAAFQVIGHVFYMRLDLDLAVHLKDSLTLALKDARGLADAASTSRH